MSYTPAPVSKWTASSLIKLMDNQWGYFLEKILNSDLPKYEKNERIDRLLPFIKLIHEQCKNKEIAFKKLV